MAAFAQVDSYVEASQNISKRIQRNPMQLDSTAQDTDDYRSQLMVEAWRVQELFQKKPDAKYGEDLYVFKALWNKGYALKRTQIRQQVNFVEWQEDVDPFDLAAHVEIKDLCRRLQAEFTADEFSMLIKLADAGGCARKSYDPQSGMSLRTWERRLARIRKRAQMFLKKHDVFSGV